MKYVKSGALLLLLMLLTACQKQNNQTTYQSLPQVQSKYSADEVQTSTIAVTR